MNITIYGSLPHPSARQQLLAAALVEGFAACRCKGECDCYRYLCLCRRVERGARCTDSQLLLVEKLWNAEVRRGGL